MNPEKPIKKRSSLVVRLSALAALMILVSAGVTLYIDRTRTQRLYQGEKHKQMESVARAHAYLIAGDLRREKHFRVLQTLAKLANAEDVAWVRVTLTHGARRFITDNVRFTSYLAGVTYTYRGKKRGPVMLRINQKYVNNNIGRLTAIVNGKTVDVDSARGWQSTGVTVAPGARVTISASGAFLSPGVSPGDNTNIGPDGLRMLGDTDTIFSDQNTCALIARVAGDTQLDNLAIERPAGLTTPTRSLTVGVYEGKKRVGALSLGYFIKTPLEKAREKRITFVAQSMAPYIAAQLRAFDFLEISNFSAKMARIQDDTAYSIVLDPTNTVLFHSRKDLESKKLTDRHSLYAFAAVMNGRDMVIQSFIDRRTRRAVLDVAVPVRENDAVEAIIRIAYYKAPLDRAVRRERNKSLVLLSLLMAAGVAVSVLLAGRVSRPILHLAAVAIRIGKGDLDVRADVRSGGDELRRLSEAFNTMTRDLKEGIFVKKMFSRYVAKQVAEEILNNPDMIALGGVRQVVTILFADVRDFTAFAELHSPDEVITRLNEYLSIMVDVIFKHEGTLDKFMGDAIMAVFGSPISHDDDPLRAVRTAIEMQERLASLNALWETQGRAPFRVGIGINTGDVISGNVGDIRRMEYTVIGDSVNLASRIENLNKEFQTHIIISQSTYEHVKHAVRVRPLGAAAVKGKLQQVEVYEVLGLESKSDPQQ